MQFGLFRDWHVIVSIVLGDQAKARPLRHVVIWVVGDELLCIGLVEPIGLKRML